MKHFLSIALLFLSVFAQAQKRDTVFVFAFASDTARCRSTSPTGMGACLSAFWCYKIRELHNEMEGEIDPGFYPDRKYKNYTITIGYLNYHKQPFDKSLIIWQSVEGK